MVLSIIWVAHLVLTLLAPCSLKLELYLYHSTSCITSLGIIKSSFSEKKLCVGKAVLLDIIICCDVIEIYYEIF